MEVFSLRWFLDVEFTRFGGDLVSLALVPEFDHLPALYIALGADQFEEPSEWVQEHVMPHVNLAGVEEMPVRTSIAMGLTRETAARHVAAYLRRSDKPVIVADWPEDLSQFLMLFLTGPGRMVSSPDMDLQYRACEGFNTASVSKKPHNALFDAVALRDHCIGISE